MKAKNFIDTQKYKKRLRLSIEKIPCVEKPQKPKQKSKYEKIFDECTALKQTILTDKKIDTMDMVSQRTEYVFNKPEYKQLMENGRQIQKHEQKCITHIYDIIILAIVIIPLIVYFTHTLYAFLLFIPAVALAVLFGDATVSYKTFYKEQFLPICCHCATVNTDGDKLTFVLKKIPQHNKKHKKNTDTLMVTNQFNVSTQKSDVVAKKIVMRDKIKLFNNYNGNLVMTNKVATVFAGYTFELKTKDAATANLDNVMFGLVNRNTFYNKSSVSQFPVELKKDYHFNYRCLNKYYNAYIDKQLILSKRQQNILEKKILALTHELGDFSLYFNEYGARLLINMQDNRDGFDTTFFDTSLDALTSMGYNGLFSIIKTLYITAAMERVIYLIFEKGEKHNEINNTDTTNEIELPTPSKDKTAIASSQKLVSYNAGSIKYDAAKTGPETNRKIASAPTAKRIITRR